MKPSNDLTLVLIRGNGAPRTFNLALPHLKRNILLIAGVLFLLLVACFVFAGLYINTALLKSTPPTLTEEDRQKLQNVNELTADLAKLQNALEARKKLGAGEKGEFPVQLLAGVSTVLGDSPVQINRPTLKRQSGSNEVTLEFELQNKRPDQDRIRGYIIVLAKSPDMLQSYPEGVFSIDENVIVNFAKGETFGISRLRSTVATFSNIKANDKVAFQIFIFSSSGQILASMNYKEGQEG